MTLSISNDAVVMSVIVKIVAFVFARDSWLQGFGKDSDAVPQNDDQFSCSFLFIGRSQVISIDHFSSSVCHAECHGRYLTWKPLEKKVVFQGDEVVDSNDFVWYSGLRILRLWMLSMRISSNASSVAVTPVLDPVRCLTPCRGLTRAPGAQEGRQLGIASYTACWLGNFLSRSGKFGVLVRVW